jgi:AcrR family transcriptional regulator
MSTKYQDIIDAAARIFLRDGFSAARTTEIAREARVSSRTLYKYFSSKTALFGEIMVDMTKKLSQTFAKTTYPDSDPHAALMAFARNYLELVLSKTALDLRRLVIAEAKRFPELGLTFIAAGHDRAAKALADYLTEQNALGTLNVPDPIIAADQFQGFVLGSLRLRAYYDQPVPGRGISLERWMDSAVTLFLRGCGYEPRRKEPTWRARVPRLHRRHRTANGYQLTSKLSKPKTGRP